MDRGITKFMLDNDNDKREIYMYIYLENKLGKCKQGMQEIGNKHAKQTRYAIPTLSGNWRTQPHDEGILLTQWVQPQSRARWSNGLRSCLAHRA